MYKSSKRGYIVYNIQVLSSGKKYKHVNQNNNSFHWQGDLLFIYISIHDISLGVKNSEKRRGKVGILILRLSCNELNPKQRNLCILIKSISCTFERELMSG